MADENTLRERALTFFAPSVYESWLDGWNDFLGARPRDLLALGEYERLAEALVAAEQKVWGGIG